LPLTYATSGRGDFSVRGGRQVKLRKARRDASVSGPASMPHQNNRRESWKPGSPSIGHVQAEHVAGRSRRSVSLFMRPFVRCPPAHLRPRNVLGLKCHGIGRRRLRVHTITRSLRQQWLLIHRFVAQSATPPARQAATPPAPARDSACAVKTAAAARQATPAAARNPACAAKATPGRLACCSSRSIAGNVKAASGTRNGAEHAASRMGMDSSSCLLR
jgi:hypothetical protein